MEMGGSFFMDTIVGFFTEHPNTFKIMVALFVITIAFFLLKQFIKLSFALLLIALAGAGYHYYHKPDNISDDIHKVKNLYKDSKTIANKAASLPGEVNKLLTDSNDESEKIRKSKAEKK
jgi:hypothetical protein